MDENSRVNIFAGEQKYLPIILLSGKFISKHPSCSGSFLGQG